MIEPDTLQTSLRDLGAIFFRRMWSIAAIFVLTLGGAITWELVLRDDLYEVTAKLLVKFAPEQATQATMTSPRNQVVGYRQQDVNSEVEILKSLEMVSRTVDELGLDKRMPSQEPEGLWRRVRYQAKKFVSSITDWFDEVLIRAGFRQRLTDREKAIAGLDRGLSVSSQGDSNIIVVRLKIPSRESAAGVLNFLVDTYLATRHRLFEDKGAAQVFEKQTEDMRERLRRAGQDMRRLELGTNLGAITVRKEILLRRAADIRGSMNEDVIRLSESQGKLDRLREQLASASPDIGVVGSFKADTFGESLVKDMADLRRKQEQLRMTEFDGSAQLQNNRAQFGVLAAIMESNLESTVRERRTVSESRAKELARIQDEFATVQARESEWVTLKREINILEQRYEFYQKKYEDAVAGLALEGARIGNVVVVQAAQDPLRPAGISRSVFVVIATALAALGALSWAAIAEFLDHRVRTVDDVERRLAAPTFATVPFNKSAVNFAGKVAALTSDQIGASFGKAALALVKAMGSAKAKSVALSGTGAGAGTTTVALQVARHIRAIYDCRVVVVEIDTQRASLCGSLGLDPERTLQAYLRGERSLADCLNDGPGGVKILPSARGPSIRHDLGFAQLALLLAELEQAFDYVLLDMPPLLERPEFLIAGQAAPQAVIVVESERARYEVLQRIRTELAHEGITLLGAILNKNRRFIPSWIYRTFVE